jgi:hypothetical protein
MGSLHSVQQTLETWSGHGVEICFHSDDLFQNLISEKGFNLLE